MSTRADHREILFLQGLPGDFFRDLARIFDEGGHGVHRINFNGGDVVSGRFARSVNYHGSVRDWPSFLARVLVDRAITDVVMFGDCRPLHRAARATAAGLGVAVHVFEEGYIRPDWVTLERGGVNGFSPMPADPDWYRRTAAILAPTVERPRLPSSFGVRAKATIDYYLAAALLCWAFPLYRTHRPWPPAAEAVGWLLRLAGRGAAARRSAAAEAALKARPYFVLPLQLDSDSQLRAHSDFDGMGPALAGVIASFARQAPPDVHLVVKEHPLDNGLTNWRRQTMDYARALGVHDRVAVLEVGDVEPLVHNARGVVTVNSTTGTLALAAGVPVITLGRAIYDLPGLTHQGALDTFWSAPEAPDLELYESYRRVIAHRCLLWGGFYDQQSRASLVHCALERILAPSLADLADVAVVTAIDDYPDWTPTRAPVAAALAPSTYPRLRLVSRSAAASAPS